MERIRAWFRRYGRPVGFHLLAWLLYFAVNNLLIFFSDIRQVTPQRTIFTYSLVAALFYTNVYGLVKPLVAKRQYWLIPIYTVALLAAFIGLRYLLFYVYFPAVGYPNEYRQFNTMYAKFLPDSLWVGMQYLLFSYGYWFAIHSLALERQKRHIQNDLLRVEKAKSEKELAFLRAQLNPHFMYNTLNFFYSEAIGTSPQLADGILALASMMRTVTELSDKATIPVHNELEHIRNYIQLQRMRFEDRMYLFFDVQGEEYERYLYLPPLVLISLVENLFKHGELADPDHPAHIRIRLEENGIYYSSSNLKKEFPVYSQGGVGMKNIDNQLTSLYKEKYKRVIREEGNVYFVEMYILMPES
ncbi:MULTISPECIES: sensor histidine kinase [Spirosoma]|uniref:sensor histidine kinase n=1 Tax=Spirosoma TaxID=107 RepID=UPI00137471CE|nr:MULTISPECIES: sensor histidine kinase [Spirosoma]